MSFKTSNSFIDAQKRTPTWGKFVEDFSYASAALERVGTVLQSAHTHNYASLLGQNDIFDEFATA